VRTKAKAKSAARAEQKGSTELACMQQLVLIAQRRKQEWHKDES